MEDTSSPIESLDEDSQFIGMHPVRDMTVNLLAIDMEWRSLCQFQIPPYWGRMKCMIDIVIE